MADNQNKLTRFWQELKRRKVVGIIIVYATTAFILIQLANLFESSLNLPSWFDTVITIALIIGFPIAIIFSWVFDVSSKGIQKTDSLEQESQPDKKSLSTLKFDPPDKSILVLPFDNLSSDPEQEYFSDGLTEEIITDLSFIEDLLVISRSSAMTFKGTKQTIKEIAGKVNVRYVLEGSVRKSGNQLRIVAQLIDAQSDTHIWAKKYDDPLENIFKVQERISGLIASSLKIKLSEKEKDKIKVHSGDDLVTLECWFRAKQEIHHYTPESLNRAYTILEDRLRVGGENELLYWGLGYINWFYVNMCIYLDDAYLKKAESFAEKIFHLNKESFYGYQLLGLIVYKRGDAKNSIYYTRKALDIEPNNPEALDHIIMMYGNTGKTHKSYELIDTMLAVDPLTSHNHCVKGFIYLMEGKFEESLSSYYRAHELDSQNIVWKVLYAHALLMAKQNEKAMEIINPIEENPTDIFCNLLIFIKNAFIKNREEALKSVKDEFFEFAKWDEWLCWMLAQSFALIGESDKALYWLENAVNRDFINYPFLSEYDFTLENIRGKPKFKKLMKRVKKEWENFEV